MKGFGILSNQQQNISFNEAKARQVQESKANIKSPVRSGHFKRLGKKQIEESICFISPKKIGYYQNIDNGCLSDKQKEIIKYTKQKLDQVNNSSSFKIQQNQIDYQSIKKCLSPRSYKLSHSQSNNKEYQKQEFVLIKLDEIYFYQKMIKDLKNQVLEINQMLQLRQQEIIQKDIKIADLQRELNFSSVPSDSSKSISTSSQEKSRVEFFNLFEQKGDDSSLWLQNKLRQYECLIKKLHIEVDVLKKYRFDRQKFNCQINTALRINQSLKRKMDRLCNKNLKLMQQIANIKLECSCRYDRSVIFEYSPQKNNGVDL